MPRLLPHIQMIRTGVAKVQRVGIVVICVMLLALPGLFPAAVQAAVQAAGGAGDWIEICGSDGVELVRVDLVSGTPVPADQPCPDCDDCLMCAVFGPSLVSAPAGLVVSPHSTGLAHTSYAQDIPENPAKFWPENRGPPRARSAVYPSDPRAIMAAFPFERRAS